MVFILMKVQAHFSSKNCHKIYIFLKVLNEKTCVFVEQVSMLVSCIS